MFLLDTNVISELRHGKAQASESVRRWAGSIATVQMYLSAVLSGSSKWVCARLNE